MERRQLMNNNLYDQTGANVYTYLTQVQSAYSRYLQMKTQLKLLDNNLKVANDSFEKNPNVLNLGIVQNAWNQKYNFMQQIPSIADSIVTNLVAATKTALSSLQICLIDNNRMGVILNESTLASVCTYVEQNTSQLNLLPYYRQRCNNEGIHIQISDIEMRARMNGIITPNFDRLKVIIRGF